MKAKKKGASKGATSESEALRKSIEGGRKFPASAYRTTKGGGKTPIPR